MSNHSIQPDFDLDWATQPAVALRLRFLEHEAEIPIHRHHKSQLVLALRGAVTCQVADALWIVPPQCGMWIPGGMLHSNRATPNALLCYLFAESDSVALPRHSCTLSISPMVREMILHLADAPQSYEPGSRTDRFARVLLDELAVMPMKRFSLPVTDHPKISVLADVLRANPGDRSTIAQWAKRLAMSESTLARLVVAETGLSFGRWRQQLHLLVAIRELASGVSVQQVSADLGYESVTAFITMFRKALGKSPAKYLNSITPGDSSAIITW